MLAEYHVENFGCRSNRADGEAIAAELRQKGLRPALSLAEAEIVVVNTCSVTAEADRTARSFLRRVRRENPTARILVTGCYAQRAPAEVAALEGVHAVIGNSHKALLPPLAVEAASSFVPLASLTGQENAIPAAVSSARAAIWADDAFAHAFLSMAEPAAAFGPEAGEHSQTRPVLKAQEGCGNRCSFCVIPTTRGPSRSLPLEQCLRSAVEFASAGGVELVLSGINLGRWGRDLTPPRTLEELVRSLLSRVQRLRLSSIEPMDWTPELLSLFPAEPSLDGLARHAHLPLQSGSDAILRAMHRRYRPWHYAEKLHAIRHSMPGAAIGADVMVGFPGENEALFEESFAFIEAQPLTYLHLFPFSPRPGTAAWEMPAGSRVAPQVIGLRMERLRRLIAEKNLAFRKSFLGIDLPAITLRTPENERSQGVTRALTDNFLNLRLQGVFPPNRSLWATITAVEGEGLAGRPVA